MSAAPDVIGTSREECAGPVGHQCAECARSPGGAAAPFPAGGKVTAIPVAYTLISLNALFVMQVMGLNGSFLL